MQGLLDVLLNAPACMPMLNIFRRTSSRKKSIEMAPFRRLAQEYKIYKDSFAMSRKFDPSNGSLGETLS